jgi:hypothetical protein
VEERGFDALQKGQGAMLLIASTVLLTLIIFAGGYFLYWLERKHRAEERLRQDETPHS